MKYFFRSIKYFKPYSIRLIIAMVCVLLIAVLWGGGIGMLLPGMKVLTSPEGLHGWAWNQLAQDHLNAKVIASPAMALKLNLPGSSVMLENITVKGSAFEAGLKNSEWIIGTGDSAEIDADSVPDTDSITRRIALTEDDSEIYLRVFNQDDKSIRTVKARMGKASSTSKLLGAIACRIPEPQSRAERFPVLIYLVGIVVIMTITRNLLRFFQEYLVRTAVFRAVADIRRHNFNVALHLPVTFFSREGTTDTMSRFVKDTNMLARAQNTLFGKTLVEPAKAVASITLALILNWELTLIVMVSGPVAYVLIRKFGKVMKKASKKALTSWSEMLAVLEETLNGIRVVKAYTMETAERMKFLKVNRQLVKQQRRMARTNSAISPSVEAIGMIAGGVAISAAGYLVFNGNMSTETFLTWMAALAAIFDPVRKLSNVLTRFQQGDAAAERIFELQDRELEKRTPVADRLPRHSQSIRFENVSFVYPGTTRKAVDNVELDIEAGRTIALVGPNGCGKTTLVSLLPRLMEPTEGRITIDGHDISTHSLRSLREQIAVVTQEAVIFNATIAENIAYGLRRPDREKILEAADRAFVTEFVNEMEDGFDSMVGQRGATLSGGQRQRIAIARAIIRNPAILIFDEALSQIDSESESRIHMALDSFVKDRTTLMVAHRFNTILEADTIVVMDAGSVLDIGKHEDLLGRCKLYEHLYSTQFLGTSEDKESD